MYLRDVEVRRSGPLCALDVDGVLESEQLGFPALTPASALTLRSLMLHGYRPLLVSGRSLDEIVERCAAYGLAGGVAEYGAVGYVAEGERVRELLPDEASPSLPRSALSSARSTASNSTRTTGLRFAPTGRRTGLGAACTPRRSPPVSSRPAPSGSVRSWARVRRTSWSQASTRATGLRALAGELDLGQTYGGEKPFALAVGDTASDIPLAALSRLACAPAHARDILDEAGFEIMRAPYQAGLAKAAARLLGHAPGGCSVCRPPSFTPERQGLLTVLAAPAAGVAEHGCGGPEGCDEGRMSTPASASRAPDAHAQPGGRLSRSSVGAHLRVPLYREGYALVLNSGLVSLFGVLYWLLAAHYYSPHVLGLNSAAISAMMFLAGVSQLNLMSALMRFIPVAGRQHDAVRALVVPAFALCVAAVVAARVPAGHSDLDARPSLPHL